MKNIENMKALNDMAMEAVAGGDDDYTVVDAFVEWLLSPIGDALNSVAGGDEDRPLPFPQDRRGLLVTGFPSLGNKNHQLNNAGIRLNVR